MAARSLLSQFRNAGSIIRQIQSRSVLRPIQDRQRILHAQIPIRPYSTEPVEAPDYLDESERKIFSLLKESLQPSRLEVQDTSGGCGSMYSLDIVSEQFKGLSTIKQHRLVNKVLGEEIKKWHGVQLKTKAR